MPATTPQVAGILAELERFTERAVRTVAVEVTAELQLATPVDTGFARASWVPSVGTPSDADGGSPDAPSQAAAEQGLARVAAYRLADGKAFVTNNVAYIRRLDQGHSKQAPAGFVRASVERGVNEAARVLAASPARSGG